MVCSAFILSLILGCAATLLLTFIPVTQMIIRRKKEDGQLCSLGLQDGLMLLGDTGLCSQKDSAHAQSAKGLCRNTKSKAAPVKSAKVFSLSNWEERARELPGLDALATP